MSCALSTVITVPCEARPADGFGGRRGSDAAVLDRQFAGPHSWLGGLSASLRQAILESMHRRVIVRGQRIVTTEQSDRPLRIVCRGVVRMSVQASNGSHVALDHLYAGEPFDYAEVALQSRGEVEYHPIGEKAEVGSLELDALRAPEADLHELKQALLRDSCAKLRRLYEAVEDLQTQPLQTRVAKSLLDLNQRQPSASWPGPGIFGLTQTELADMLGCSRQRLNESLMAMKRCGMLRWHHRRLELVDLEALRASALGAPGKRAWPGAFEEGNGSCVRRPRSFTVPWLSADP